MEYKAMDAEFIRQAKGWYRAETYLKELLHKCVRSYHSESRYLDGLTAVAVDVKTKCLRKISFNVWKTAYLKTRTDKEAVKDFGGIVAKMMHLTARKTNLMIFAAWAMYTKLRTIPLIPINESKAYVRGPEISSPPHYREYLPVNRNRHVMRSEAAAIKLARSLEEEEGEEATWSDKRGVHYRCFMGGSKGPGRDRLTPEVLREILRLWSRMAKYQVVEAHETVYELQLRNLGLHVADPLLDLVTGKPLAVEMQEEFIKHYERDQEEIVEDKFAVEKELRSQFTTATTRPLSRDGSENGETELAKFSKPAGKTTVFGETQFKSKEQFEVAANRAFTYNLPDHEDQGNALNYYFRGFRAWAKSTGFARSKHAAIRELFREKDERLLRNSWRRWAIQCYKFSHNTSCIEKIRSHIEGNIDTVPYLDEPRMKAYLNWSRLFTLAVHRSKWVVDLDNARGILAIQRNKYERVIRLLEDELRDVVGDTDYFQELGMDGFDLSAKARFLALQT